MSDAILFVSFGGPDQPADVMPFLENVTRGRGVPRERLEMVAEHYQHIGGKSPINAQNLAMIKSLTTLLAQQGPDLPVYFGNRNWNPLLTETFTQMRADGVTRVFAFVTSAFSSYSGCRQYRENMIAAQLDSQPIEVQKLRVYFNHPGFIDPLVDHINAAKKSLPNARLIFTAHSVPMSMANTSNYVKQLNEASRIVAEATSSEEWDLVYQSRSGAPGQPWLEPDILDHMRALHAEGVNEIILCPIGFISDHMEVMYDLDEEARLLAGELGMKLNRTPTSSTDPRFIAMIRELVVERRDGLVNKPALGILGPSHDLCPADCCPAPAARPSR